MASDTVEPLKALFGDIKIVDSSIIALPDGLKEDYKGLGGKNADSSVKLQVIYSAFNRSMIVCDLKQGTENDKVYLDEVDTHIKRGKLFLADLGYFKTEFLQNLDATNRFFIS